MSHTRPSTGHVGLVKRKRGSVWYARLRIGGVNGQQFVRKLGPNWTERGRPPEGYFTKRTAEAELRKMLADADRGTLAATRKRAGVTFEDAAEEYLRHLSEVRQRESSTLGDYRGVIKGYLLPRFGERDVASITPQEIEAYRDELMTETKKDGSRRLSNRTIVRHLVVLHAIFKRAARVWGLPGNPASAELVDRPPVRYSGEFRTLTPDEVSLVANRMERPEERALVLTAAFTGLRLGELLALRWSDVDFQLQRVHVRRSLANSEKQADGTFVRVEKAPKSGKVRSSVLVPEVIPVLDGLSKREWFTGPGDLVFCNEAGEHLSDGMLRRRFYAALDGLGLPRVKLHDLRHAFATLAVQCYEFPKVQGYLGHAHISTTMRYVHHTPGADDAARFQAVLDQNRLSNQLSNAPIPDAA